MNTNTMLINKEMLTENSEFLKAVVGAKTIEEAQRICDEFNIELPEDTWKEIEASFLCNVSNADELSENELDDISGGKINGNALLSTVGGIVGLGGAVAAGSAAGVLVACAWVGYNAYKTFK